MIAVGYFLGLLYFLWVFFLAVMTLQRSREERTLRGIALVLGMGVLATGRALDFLGNLVLSVLFWERPLEWTVTARVKRHELGPPGWRRWWAQQICKRLLNPFDPRGYHCNPP